MLSVRIQEVCAPRQEIIRLRIGMMTVLRKIVVDVPYSESNSL